MAGDLVTIPPGQSLDAYNAQGPFMIRSLRVDNPSGCWYRVENNKQIIAPYTYGTMIALDAGTRSLSITFLSSYAGQQSKIIGDALTVYLSSDNVSPANPLSIANAIPYTNTFNALFTATQRAAQTTAVSIFPTRAMRLRLSMFTFDAVDAGATQFSTIISVYGTTADGNGGIIPSFSEDSDSLVASQCIVRNDLIAPNAPTLGNILRLYKWYHPIGIIYGRFGRTYDLLGPDLPPSAYSAAGTLRGLAIVLQPVAGGSIGGEIVWTEEPL